MKQTNFLLKCAVLLLMSIGLIGCAGTGTRNRVSFDDSLYPVSLSPVVPDKNGKNLSTERLERLGTFHAYKRGWSTIWGLVPLGKIDFSDEVNRQVKAVDGKAVVNLRIRVIDSAINCWYILNWIPIWPGSVKVDVEGIIVRPR